MDIVHLKCKSGSETGIRLVDNDLPGARAFVGVDLTLGRPDYRGGAESRDEGEMIFV